MSRRATEVARPHGTGVVMTGGLRTLVIPQVFRDLKRNVVDALSADLFLFIDPNQTVWAARVDEHKYQECNRHRSGAVPWGGDRTVYSLEQVLHILRPVAHAEFNDCASFGRVTSVRRVWPAEVWASAREDLRPVNCTYTWYRRYYPQFFWMAEAYQLLLAHERQRAARYEWVVKVRTDMMFYRALSLPPMLSSARGAVYGNSYLVPPSEMLIDWWAIMTGGTAADTYFSSASSYRRCDSFAELANGTACGGKYFVTPTAVECVLTRHLLWHGVSVDRGWATTLKLNPALVHFDPKRGNVASGISTIHWNRVAAFGWTRLARPRG